MPFLTSQLKCTLPMTFHVHFFISFMALTQSVFFLIDWWMCYLPPTPKCNFCGGRAPVCLVKAVFPTLGLQRVNNLNEVVNNSYGQALLQGEENRTKDTNAGQYFEANDTLSPSLSPTASPSLPINCILVSCHSEIINMSFDSFEVGCIYNKDGHKTRWV